VPLGSMPSLDDAPIPPLQMERATGSARDGSRVHCDSIGYSGTQLAARAYRELLVKEW
jgi:hypothetical protein